MPAGKQASGITLGTAPGTVRKVVRTETSRRTFTVVSGRTSAAVSRGTWERTCGGIRRAIPGQTSGAILNAILRLTFGGMCGGIQTGTCERIRMTTLSADRSARGRIPRSELVGKAGTVPGRGHVHGASRGTRRGCVPSARTRGTVPVFRPCPAPGLCLCLGLSWSYGTRRRKRCLPTLRTAGTVTFTSAAASVRRWLSR